MNPSNRNSDPIGSTRSKPRLVKLRKHSSNNPKSNLYQETGNFESGFNPFRQSSDLLGKSSLNNDEFVFNAKTPNGFSENRVLDSMMKLNLNPGDEAENSGLENDLRNLNIASSGILERHKNENVDMEIPDGLKKLNIKDPMEADGSRINNKSYTNQCDASFPGSSDFGRVEHVLSNEMGRLKLAREAGEIPKKSVAGFSSSLGESSFSFDGFPFRTPGESIFTGLGGKKPEFNAKREQNKDSRLKKNRGKLKKYVPVRQYFVLRENTSLREHQDESLESYSPMDVSPYREPVFDHEEIEECREFFVGTAAVIEAATDENLVIATQCLDNNDDDAKTTERKMESCQFVASESFDAESETESFVTADVQLERDDSNDDTFVTTADTEVNSSSRDETEIQGFGSGPMSEDFGRTNMNFTFAAATSSAHSHSFSSTRQQKKKNRYKVSNDSAPTIKIQQSSSPTQILSPRWGQKGYLITSFAKTGGDMAEASMDQEIEQESFFTPTASFASREACDKWRLRGNQAYANGEMLRAEEYYSQGANCIFQNEKSRSCLKALMLCYSNRAATRMSLGRVREALEDCRKAAVIDPNFLRVQVRAANCYLALGDVEDASRHFTKCLQCGNDVSVERKLALEASEGLEKSRRVSEWMKQSTELVQRRNSSAAESALGVISEALTTSCYSEKLLELKAEALFMLGKYEELIHLCEQTLCSAEINHADNSSNMESSDARLNLSFRLWRWRLIIKSYFFLGRLEAALDFVKKQEESAKIGSKILESTTPLVGTIRELVLNKNAGNEAFKRGNYAEAVEHYTAALSSTVESRPFAAVCFCNRAAAYKAMDQVIDAIADCSIAIALDGNYLKAISRRASLFEMIRDYDQATKDLQREASLLIKQVEEKDGQFGPTDKLRSLNDLRQVQQRQSVMEEDAKLEIPLNMYLILGVNPSVTAFEIKKAYRKAALKHHPDKVCQFFARSECIDDGYWKEVVVEVHKNSDRCFKMIGEAYAILSDPTKRSQYDIDEEIWIAQKRGFGGRRMHTNNSPYERESGSSKREAWRTYGNNFQSRGK